MNTLNQKLRDVLNEGGALVVKSTEDGYVALMYNSRLQEIQKFTAKTIPGVLTQVGAGVTPRRALFTPGDKL